MAECRAGEGGAPRKVPVTIVTGFLGAGKTTLLNYVLSAEHGKRIAVIENEFGNEKGIERLIARDLEEGEADLKDMFVELSNGCICCSVRDDLVVTLEALLERSDKFDYIMIETTGVADPGPLVGVFWLDQELESRLYLDGVITVVDLKNLVKHLDDPRKQPAGRAEQVEENNNNNNNNKGPGADVEDSDSGRPSAAANVTPGSDANESGVQAPVASSDATSPEGQAYVNEAQKQIAYADRVILNKTDLVGAETFSEVRGRVGRINPFAKVLSSTYSKVDLDEILNVRGYEFIDNTEPTEFQRELLALEQAHSRAGHDGESEAGRDTAAGPGQSLDHAHEDGECCVDCEGPPSQEAARHDPSVVSTVVRTTTPLDLRRLQLWIGELLWEQGDGPQIFRMKGCVQIEGSETVHLLQAVHETFEIEPSKQKWGAGEFTERVTRIVFIGRYLSHDLLAEAIETQCAAASPA